PRRCDVRAQRRGAILVGVSPCARPGDRLVCSVRQSDPGQRRQAVHIPRPRSTREPPMKFLVLSLLALSLVAASLLAQAPPAQGGAPAGRGRGDPPPPAPQAGHPSGKLVIWGDT